MCCTCETHRQCSWFCVFVLHWDAVNRLWLSDILKIPLCSELKLLLKGSDENLSLLHIYLDFHDGATHCNTICFMFSMSFSCPNVDDNLYVRLYQTIIFYLL